MKKLFIILSFLIFTSLVFTSCQSGGNSNEEYKFEKPSSSQQYNNIFSLNTNGNGGIWANLNVTNIEMNGDFGAIIIYNITPNSSITSKITEKDIDTINALFDNLNSKIYNGKQYDDDNRLFYVNEYSYAPDPNSEDGTRLITGVKVFCANLNYAYASAYYNSYALKDFITTVDNGGSTYTISGKKLYYIFLDPKNENKECSINGLKKPENYKVLEFKNYTPTNEITFKVPGKIIAYYSDNFSELKIGDKNDNSKDDTMTVKLNSTSAKLYVLYETEQAPQTVWLIIIIAIFLIVDLAAFLLIRLIRSKRLKARR